MLRPKYGRLRCLAFSPPGCVFSAELAKECSAWVTSFVLDSDIMARLSIESMENLRDDILEVIPRIKVPKYQIFWNTTNSLEESISEVLYTNEEARSLNKRSEFAKQRKRFFAYQSQLKVDDKDTYIRLFPPGKMVQLFRERGKDSTTGLSLPGYIACFRENSDFNRIVLSSRMLVDHFPTRGEKALQQLASQFGMSTPYFDDIHKSHNTIIPDEKEEVASC